MIDVSGNGKLEELELKNMEFGLVMNRNVFKIQLKVDRSFSVEIPASDINNKILRLSYREDGSAFVLRGDFYAQLHYSGGFLEGRLRFSSATRDTYTATFYYNGNTNGIDVDAKIATYLRQGDFLGTEVVPWVTNQTRYSGGGATPPSAPYQIYKYRCGAYNQGEPLTGEMEFPSVQMKYLCDIAAAKMGTTIRLDISDVAELAQKSDRWERLMIKTVTHKGKGIAQLHTDYEWGEAGHNGAGMSGGFLTYFNIKTVALTYYSGSDFAGVVGVDVFEAVGDTTVDITSLYGQHNGSPISSFVYTTDGEHWSPIAAGDTLTLSAGAFFAIADGAHGTLPEYSDIMFGGTPLNPEGWTVYMDVSYVYDKEPDDPSYPYIELWNNLPDVSLADMLKTAAYALGLGLYYDEAAHEFVLSDLVMSTLSPMPEVTSTPPVVTTDALDMNGCVLFQSSSYVYLPQRAVLYLGDGDTTIYTSPFSEERISTISSTYDVVINDVTPQAIGEITGNSDKPVLCIFNDGGSQYLRRFSFLSGRLAGLVSSGLCAKVEVVQSAYEFLQQTPLTCYYLRGKRWGILSATNQSGVSTLQLLRLE